MIVVSLSHITSGYNGCGALVKCGCADL